MDPTRQTTGDAINSTANEINEIETELQSLLNGNPNQLGGVDVAELLQRLTEANTMADSMESKIDNVLQNLDNLLSTLNGEDVADSKQAASTNAESGPETRIADNNDVSGNAS
ncbi:hypothetical protein CPC08DRAFT_747084 [Agrocybe pediades]|nr:hypothetical protein CPC08DRAFT_747084 [Agrocybe pediades]